MPKYEILGLVVESDVELPAAVVVDDRCDVKIIQGPTSTNCAEPLIGERQLLDYILVGQRYYTAVHRDSEYVLRYPNLCDFHLSDGLDRIEYRLGIGVESWYVPVFLAGTVLSLLLELKGLTVLHASMVAWNGEGLGILGQSGAGKSTLAAVLCAGGADLVTDDVLVLGGQSCARIPLGSKEVRMRTTAASVLDYFAQSPPQRITGDGRIAVTLPNSFEGATLRAFVVPVMRREATNVEFELLRPKDALMTLAAFPRVGGWQDAKVRSQDFERLGKVAFQVPLYRATLPSVMGESPWQSTVENLSGLVAARGAIRAV